MKKILVSAVLATSVLTMAACGNTGISNSGDVVAKSNAGDIKAGDFYNKMKQTTGLPVLKQMVIEDYLNKHYKVSDTEVNNKFNQYKSQYGNQFNTFLKQYGFANEAAFKDRVKLDLLTQKAAQDFVTPQELQAYKPEIRASHILVKDEKTANMIEQKLKNGSKFEDLAKQYSTDPGSKDKGGDLGYFGQGVMDPTFEKAAYSLKVGEISQPVHTQFGYHIIKLVDKKPVNEKEARQKIAQANLSTQDGFTKLSDEILKKANFQIEDKDLKEQAK